MSFTGAQRIIGSVRSMMPRMITSGVVVNGEPILYCEPKHVPTVLTFLRDHSGTRCKQLTDLTAVDIPSRDKRFEVFCRQAYRCVCKACCCRGGGEERGLLRGAMVSGLPKSRLMFAGDVSAAQHREEQPYTTEDTLRGA